MNPADSQTFLNLDLFRQSFRSFKIKYEGGSPLLVHSSLVSVPKNPLLGSNF